MRFGIVGVGALGSVYGSFLNAAGEDVYLYEVEEEIVNAVKESGLRVDHPEDEPLFTRPPITTNPAEIGPVDVVFIFTKAFDTEQAIQDAEPMLDETTRVVTVQNGVLNMDIISEYVPKERVLGGYTRAGANKINPGHVRFMGVNSSALGGDDRETANQVAETLTAAEIPTEAVADPLPHIWKKQFRNVARKPLSALTELPNGPQGEYEETREIARHLIKEAMAVARAKDITILPDDPVGDFLRPVVPEKYDKKSSILEDVLDERPTEIDHINGAVVKYGEEEGIETPYNRMAASLVKAKEYSYLDEPTREP